MSGAHAASTPRRPFAGIRVLDVTRVVAGPFASYQLGLLGAEVIKIEDPLSRGDTMRYRKGTKPAYGANGMATFYLSQSANKKSMTLDLRKPEARAIFRKMALEADVLVENLRAGAMARMGFGYEDLKDENPRLVYCSLTGFGHTGPKRTHGAYDPVIQAASGLMSVNGTADIAPVRVGAPVMDYSAGLAAAFGIASALFERSRSGLGQYVDVSMLDTALVMMGALVTEAATAQSLPKPPGNRAPAETYGNACFQCADGLISIAAMEPYHRARMWQAMGRADIPADARFATDELCSRNIDLLHAEMERTFRTRGAQAWEDILNEAGVPAARARTIPEALAMEQVQARGVMHTMHDVPGITGAASFPTAPFLMSAGGVRVDSPPPLLGQHTDEILATQGYDAAGIARLREEGVV
ncbi:CaiB/BaiF CoA-transferase family protein [Variovorax sp. KK3]|uniref:CaiB/BaiF CoA transferase family protein n=1 Tax=Variovorax sp. KK3 TaxID=1855728 RepID=UPI00097C488E|nr:CoA transferase [Variovorax sp. KK3]